MAKLVSVKERLAACELSDVECGVLRKRPLGGTYVMEVFDERTLAKGGSEKLTHRRKIQEMYYITPFQVLRSEFMHKRYAVETRAKHIKGCAPFVVHVSIEPVTLKDAQGFYEEYSLGNYDVRSASLHLGVTSREFSDGNELVAVLSLAEVERGAWKVLGFDSKVALSKVTDELLSYLDEHYIYDTLSFKMDFRICDDVLFRYFPRSMREPRGYRSYWVSSEGKVVRTVEVTNQLLSEVCEQYDMTKSKWENLRAHGWSDFADVGGERCIHVNWGESLVKF